LVEGATNVLYVFNTSATMARQGDWVQPEQVNMGLALNMAKTAKESCLRAAIGKTKYNIKKPYAEVWEVKTCGVEFPWHQRIEVAIQSDLAMSRQNKMSGCRSCQQDTAKNLLSCWRCTGAGAPAPNQHRQRIPELTLPLPGMSPIPTGNTSGAHGAGIVDLAAPKKYSHTAIPSGECFDHDEDT
jgi:hypothetical protein